MTLHLLNVCVFSLWSLFIQSVFADDLCKLCTCGPIPYHEQLPYIVNCTNVGITGSNVDLLQQLPEPTEVLIFNGNKISELPANIFGNEKNLTNLKVIDMTDNGIEEIKGKTFHHVPFVRRLVLNHNSLNLSSKLHPRVFSNFDNLHELHLTDAFLDYTSSDLAEQLHSIFTNSNLNQLQKLHLEQNEIQTFVDQNVFCDLKNLTDLYLGNNKLKGLNFEIKCLPHLRYIDLEANEIQSFSTEALAAFDSFPEINHTLTVNINKNPFLCDCITNSLYFWLKRTKIIVKDNRTIQCHFSHNTNYSIYLKDYSANNCNSISNPYTEISNDTVEHRFIHYFFLSMSTILVVILIYLSIKYSSIYCRNVVRPTSKVHYIVIRNPDENREVHV